MKSHKRNNMPLEEISLGKLGRYLLDDITDQWKINRFNRIKDCPLATLQRQ